MEGRDEPVEERGIMPNTFAYVFEQIAKESELAAGRGVHEARRATYVGGVA